MAQYEVLLKVDGRIMVPVEADNAKLAYGIALAEAGKADMSKIWVKKYSLDTCFNEEGEEVKVD